MAAIGLDSRTGRNDCAFPRRLTTFADEYWSVNFTVLKPSYITTRADGMPGEFHLSSSQTKEPNRIKSVEASGGGASCHPRSKCTASQAFRRYATQHRSRCLATPALCLILSLE